VVEPTPLKNMKVSWDDEIPNMWKHNPNVPNHQPIVISPVHVWTLVFLTRFYDFAISAWDVGLYMDTRLGDGHQSIFIWIYLPMKKTHIKH